MNMNLSGFEFDTGVHYIGGDVQNKKSPIGFLFDLLSLNLLTWQKLDDSFDVAKISSLLSSQAASSNDQTPTASPTQIEFQSNLKFNLNKHINQIFPNESQNMTVFFRLVDWAKIGFQLFAGIKLLPLFVVKIIRRYIGPYFFDPLLKSSTHSILKSCFGDNEVLIGKTSDTDSHILLCVIT
jgi:hypothetical protein